MCCWQLLAVSEQPAETGTLRLQRHLQLKQTGVMQEPLKQALLLFKMETPSEGPWRNNGQSRGEKCLLQPKAKLK